MNSPLPEAYLGFHVIPCNTIFKTGPILGLSFDIEKFVNEYICVCVLLLFISSHGALVVIEFSYYYSTLLLLYIFQKKTKKPKKTQKVKSVQKFQKGPKSPKSKKSKNPKRECYI